MTEIAMSVQKDQMRSFHEDCRELLKMEIDEDSLLRDQIVCRTALDNLTVVPIRELAMDQQNVGKYLLLRVLEEGYTRADCSWFNVVEDQLGEAIGLALYNYPLDEVFSPGTIFAIKEPYLKLKMKLPFIRCDCPTDILVMLPSHHNYQKTKNVEWKNPIKFEDPLSFDPVPSSSEEWRARGNELFRENKLVLAQEAYFLGRKMCDENDPNAEQILLNLLQVELSLEYYDWVIEQAEQLPKEDKALFRLGKAHYMLRQYENAVSAFRNTIQLWKETGKLELKVYKKRVDETRDMLKRAETRVKEARGEFSIDDIINESKINPFQEINCADFCVPMKRTNILGKGKGLTLGTKVKKGDVVMISKSWATAFRKERDVQKDATEIVNLENKSNVDDDGLRAKVVSKLTKLVYKNPKSFGSLLFDTKSKPFQLFLDVNRINEIYVSNGFTMFHAESRARTGSGFFYFPSFLNHSCEPNVDYKFYNDVMVITALEDIAVGTELTINHVILDLNYQERTNLLEKRGVVCTCLKCVKKFNRNVSFRISQLRFRKKK